MGELSAGLERLVSLPVGAITLQETLLAMLFAFVAGQVVAWCYVRTHGGISYSRAYVQSLVLIAVIVAFVMVVVGSNVVIAFGLLGAMTVIRFRNVLKDTRDTAFIFMEVGVGLGAGTGNVSATFFGTLLFVGAMFALHLTDFGTRHLHDALLRFQAPQEMAAALDGILYRHCQKFALVSERAGAGAERFDYSYRLLLRDPSRSRELLAELTASQGVTGVSLLHQADHSEV